MLTVLTLDNALGYCDRSSLSDQTRMELLIEGTTENTKSLLQDNEGFYADVCTWGGGGIE